MIERGKLFPMTTAVMRIPLVSCVMVLSACIPGSTPVQQTEPTRLSITQDPTEPLQAYPTSLTTNTPTITPGQAENSTTANPAALHTVKVIEDVPYHTSLNEEVTENKLDIYSPVEPGDWPVVVVFHGGGGSKSGSLAILSSKLAERGAVVLTPDIFSIRAQADEPVGMREFLEKHDCVVRFASSQAAAYGGDPKNIVVFGESAGGYGGLWISLVGDKIEQIWDDYNVTQGEAERQVGCLAEGSAENVDAIVGFGGAYAYFEVSLRQEQGELLKVLSPSTYFGENHELIIRFIHGENDSIVPETAVQKHKEWIEELANMGYDAAWMEMVGGHGLDARTFDPVVEVIMEVAQR